MGKRSPILGYNHNVRYRGLVFHVQTEDSGVSSPHLFTHLFHHGVIVSTRKLDYDAGSAEESIKSLMQAQHKAVLKDLRRGQFDDKIDSYLGGTPGLLPRGAEEPAERPSEVELAPSTGAVGDAAPGATTEQVLPLSLDDLSAPIIIVEDPPAPPAPPSLPRASAPAIPPPPPRVTGVRAAASGPTTAPAASAGRGGSGVLDATLPTAAPEIEIAVDSEFSTEIEIQLVEDSDAIEFLSPRRTVRDTETQGPPDRAQAAADDRRAHAVSDGVPGPIRPSNPAIPPPPPDSRRLGDRPSTIHAATLPPARPISRPPSRSALNPPPVVSRPLAPEERKSRDTEGVEVYSPAPPSAELPASDRSGQYAQHKRVTTRPPVDGHKHERSGSAPVPIPAGLGRPQRPVTLPTVKQGTPVPSASASIPAARDPAARSPATEPLRGRVPTPARLPVTSRSGATSGGGVVMTRPGVIVGAPGKSAGTVPRIRKAREDEGRGFGQGLISEKSLDEVILAYLSEDADEK